MENKTDIKWLVTGYLINEEKEGIAMVKQLPGHRGCMASRKIRGFGSVFFTPTPPFAIEWKIKGVVQPPSENISVVINDVVCLSSPMSVSEFRDWVNSRDKDPRSVVQAYFEDFGIEDEVLEGAKSDAEAIAIICDRHVIGYRTADDRGIADEDLIHSSEFLKAIKERTTRNIQVSDEWKARENRAIGL